MRKSAFTKTEHTIGFFSCIIACAALCANHQTEHIEWRSGAAKTPMETMSSAFRFSCRRKNGAAAVIGELLAAWDSDQALQQLAQ